MSSFRGISFHFSYDMIFFFFFFFVNFQNRSATGNVIQRIKNNNLKMKLKQIIQPFPEFTQFIANVRDYIRIVNRLTLENVLYMSLKIWQTIKNS